MQAALPAKRSEWARPTPNAHPDSSGTRPVCLLQARRIRSRCRQGRPARPTRSMSSSLVATTATGTASQPPAGQYRSGELYGERQQQLRHRQLHHHRRHHRFHHPSADTGTGTEPGSYTITRTEPCASPQPGTRIGARPTARSIRPATDSTAPAPAPAPAPSISRTVVYGDSLMWDNWSWGSTIDLAATQIQSGTASMGVTYTGAGGAASFRVGAPVAPAGVGITFWAYGSAAGNTIDVRTMGTDGGAATMAKRISIPAGVWRQITRVVGRPRQPDHRRPSQHRRRHQRAAGHVLDR